MRRVIATMAKLGFVVSGTPTVWWEAGSHRPSSSLDCAEKGQWPNSEHLDLQRYAGSVGRAP
jgi:hypothetical protein